MWPQSVWRSDEALPVALDDERLTVPQRPIGNPPTPIVGDVAVDQVRFRMVRFEMDSERKGNKPKSVPDDLRIVAGGNIVWIVDDLQSTQTGRRDARPRAEPAVGNCVACNGGRDQRVEGGGNIVGVVADPKPPQTGRRDAPPRADPAVGNCVACNGGRDQRVETALFHGPAKNERVRSEERRVGEE